MIAESGVTSMRIVPTFDDLKVVTPASLALRAEVAKVVGFLTATHTNSIPAA